MEPSAWDNRCMDSRRSRAPGRPWFAFTLGSCLPAALAAAHAPWMAVAVAGSLNAVMIVALYLFMEGARPAQEWASVWGVWQTFRASSSSRRRSPGDRETRADDALESGSRFEKQIR